MKANPKGIAWGGCIFRYDFGMRADAKGELKYDEIHFIS
jgi:hypothetical protein